ncbi:hypothetical protein V5O48_011186 [Marasmius crinis-equi]|uniref:Uncharacterized protein n=1 Tax=Marasmius crinis-equi TaxID=585013 RepID=A0ABR3F6B2_9AGAR
MAQDPEHQGQPTHSEFMEWKTTFDVGTWGGHLAQSEEEDVNSATSHSETPFLSIEDLAQCEVSQWYSDLRRTNPASTQIDKLQVRRGNSYWDKVTHRFVVLYMCDESVHRLDRRARNLNNPGLLSNLSFATMGRVSTTDELTRNVDAEELKKGTHLEIEITLDGNVDLWVVLSTCHAISKDPDGQKYDLREHNCFFFSWTILMVASRYHLDIRTPLEKPLMERLEHENHIYVLTKFVAGKGIDAFRDLIFEVVSAFLHRKQDSHEEKEGNHKGMSYLARVIRGLPERVPRFFGRSIFDAMLFLGLRETFEGRVRGVLLDRARKLYRQVIANVNPELELRKPLWVDDLKHVIRSEVRKEVADLLWPGVIEAITQGFGLNVGSGDLAKQIFTSVGQSCLRHVGARTVQLWAVQTAALHGGLVNVQREVQDRAQRIRQDAKVGTDNPEAELRKLNERMFDLAWNSAREGALESAKEAAKETAPSLRLKHQEVRDAMWNTVWKVWDECWKNACARAREKALDTLDAIVTEIMDVSARIVLEELGAGKMQPTVCVHTPKNLLDLEDQALDGLYSGWKGPMTSLKLQEHMQRVMQKAKFGSPDDLQRTMARIWVQVRELGTRFEKALIGEEFKGGIFYQTT